MRILGIWVVLIASLALAACSGGGDSVSNATPKNFVSAQAAMEASATSYETQVQSFQGTMSIGFEANGEDFSTIGDMKYQAPDNVYLKMNMPTLGDMEILLDGSDIYFGMGGKWYTGDTSAFGIDLSEFEKYAHDHGPVDYTSLLNGLKNLEKLPDEDIDGHTYWHYHADLDPASLGDDIPAGAIDPSILQTAAAALSGTTMDVYVDPQTLLPRRYTMAMSMDFSEDAAFKMNMKMDFEKYNEDVDMPDPPSDAKPFNADDVPLY